MDPADLEKRAKERVQARFGLLVHVLLYVAVNAALIVIWAVTGANYPWFLWPLFGWGIAIVSHVLAFLFGPGSQREERAVDRELRRLRERPH